METVKKNTERKRGEEAEHCQESSSFCIICMCCSMTVCLCVFSQVTALYFTSAQISLFEKPRLSIDLDSAGVIQWDELVKGKHRFCYTVTHQVHAPAWVRKGREQNEKFYLCMLLSDNNADTNLLFLAFFDDPRVTCTNTHKRVFVVASFSFFSVFIVFLTPSTFHIVCK